MKRQMYDSSLTESKDISLGNQPYNPGRRPLYANAPEEVRSDLLNNFTRTVDRAEEDIENFENLGQYGVGRSRFDKNIVAEDVPYLQNIRADRQGPIAQFGSFLNQAVVGELVGGTIEGIGYLFELNEFADLMSGEDEDFGNAVSQTGKAIKDWTREVTPVYEYDTREGDFRPWDWSWWMTNGSSIASSISLMIPSGAVAAIPARFAKALSFSGKYAAAIRAGRSVEEAAQIANKFSTTTSRTVAGLTQAVTSRKMESMMEASGTYDEAYQMALNSGKSDDEARQIAAKSAKNNYVANWAMLAQDVPQYLFLNKYLGKFRTGMADDAAKKGMTVAAKNEVGQNVSLKDYVPTLKGSYTLGKDMLGEAGEEAYQYLSNQYGLYSAERMINPDMDVSFLPWMKENIDMGEIMTNAFFGAIGAGFMQGVGRPMMDKIRGIEDDQVLEIRSIAERYATIGKNILNAQKVGDDYKLAMELSKGGAELGIRAAMGNSKELLDSFINLVDSGDFSTASKDLKDFADSEEGKAILAQDKQNASEIKKYAIQAYDMYNETLSQINQEGHTFNKGYTKALANLKKTGRDLNPEWYKKALASVMASTVISKEIIDNKVTELEDQLEQSKSKYEKSANQAFRDLSGTGKAALFNSLELEALKNVQKKDSIINSEESVKNMPSKAKADLENWRKEVDKEIKRREAALQTLEDSYPEDDKKNDSKIKVNKADLLEYKEFSNKLYTLKRDSYIFGQALKRYNNGDLLSDTDIEKYAKEFEERQDEQYEAAWQIGDTVTIGKDGQPAIIENVKFIGNKIRYEVRPIAINEEGDVEEASDTTEYDAEDLWLYETSKVTNSALVDTVSSTIQDTNNDPNAELRKELHNKGLNDPLMTLDDMISMSHVDKDNPTQVFNRDPKLNSQLSRPASDGSNIDSVLSDSRVEYSLDLGDDQKFWDNKQDLKKKILAIKGNKKLSQKTKEKRINELIESLLNETNEENFNYTIDTIPIKIEVILKDGDTETAYDGTDQYNLYLHNSDFWNIDAPISIYMEGGPDAAEAYILHQRIKTRKLRATLLTKLLGADIAVGQGLKRYGGHLNRVGTYGTVHDRLGEELSDVDLYIGLQDTDGIAYPFLESGVKAPWTTKPGSVLFRTIKTLTGEPIFIPATISNLSKEHAEIIWDSYITIANGFGYSAKLGRPDVINATVGEILDLTTTQGEKVSANMADKSQVLYLKGRKELHFGDQTIKDITKANASQRGKFIKWASENKKYRVPFEVKKLGFKLNSTYKNKSGIKIGSFDIKPGDTRTWAQMMMSTPISGSKSGSKYAIVTNIERVVDEETGNFRETVIHSPALKVVDPNPQAFEESIEQLNVVEPIIPSSDNKEQSWMDKAIDVLAKYVDKSYGEWGKTMAYPDSSTILNLLEKSKNIPEDIRIRLSREGLGITQVEKIDDILGSTIVIGDDDTVTGFYRTPDADKETDTISQGELTWLKDRLKSGSTTEMSDRFLEVMIDGKSKQAYGLFKASAIYLYSGGVKGTVYHESFHRVSLGYLSDRERERFYKNARIKYNIPDASEAQIEEKLAEEFRAWRNHIELNADLGKRSITDWIKNLFNFIKHYFTGTNAIQDYEIDTLFRLIDRGAFMYHTIKRKRLQELEGREVPLEISSLGEGSVEVPFVNNRSDFNDFIKGLSNILIVQNGVNDLADVKGMKFSKMFNYINEKLIPNFEQTLNKLNAYKRADNFKEGLTEEDIAKEIYYVERAIDLYKSISNTKYRKIYMSHLKNILKLEYSINVVEDQSEETLSEDDTETLSPQELITRYSKESFELNIVDNVTSNIKFLIATLPESSEINPITKTVKFVKFHDTWYNLLFHLHELNSVEDMMEQLKELGETNHAFNTLYKKLERRSPNLRNQFKTAVNKHKHMFINFTYTIDDERTPSYQIYRADINRAEEEEKYSWAENFINSNYMDHGSKVGDIQKLNIDNLTSVYEEYVTFEKKVQKESRKQLSPEELESYKETFLNILRSVYIDIDMRVLDAYLLSKIRTVGKKVFGARDALYTLITSEFTSNPSREGDQQGYFYKLKVLAESALQREQDVATYNAEKAKGKKGLPPLPLYDLDSDIRSIYTTKDSLYVIRELARKKFEVHPDLLNDIVIGPNGHQYFTYALNTYTTDKIKQLKDKAFVDSKLAKTYNKHSLFLQQLSASESAREKLSLRTMSAFQERDTNDAGSSYSDLNTIEDYVLRLGALHNSETLVPFPIIADRSTYYFLDGLSIPKSIYEFNPETGKLEFTNEIIDIFLGYAEDERERIRESKNVIKEYNEAVARKDGSDLQILKNKMILNYHYKLKGGKVITQKANSLEYIDFKEFNNKDFNFDRDARRLIIEHLEKAVQFGMERARKLGVYKVSIEEEDNSEVYSNALIDTQLFKSYSELYPTHRETIQAIIAFNEIGMVISNFEVNKMFVGDPAFYKGDKPESIQQDRIKRLMVLTSSGDAIHQKTTEKNIIDEHFTMAALSTQKINMSKKEYNQYDPSNYYYTLRNLMIVRYSQMLIREMKRKGDPLYAQFKHILEENYLIDKDGSLEFEIEKVNKLEKEVLKDVFGVDINDILEAYREVDSTDGQAYVSPEMYRSMLIQIGEWPEWKEGAYNNIMRRTKWEDMSYEEQDSVLKLYMQPLKPVFFDLIENGTVEVPTYLKMSIMPLFPGLVDNTILRDLADRMEAVGKYKGLQKINMVPYDSAIKVGLGYTVPLYKDQYSEEGSDLSDMHAIKLPFSSLRKQLVTDPHNITETKLGTQVVKISLSDLILDEKVYNVDGIDGTISGKEIAEIVFNCLASVSDKGLIRFKEKIGYDDKTKQIDLSILAKTLREDAIKSNMPDMISDAFRTDKDKNLYLELDTFSNRKQIFSRLIGMVTKQTIDIKMPGNQFIQLSATGLTTTSSNNLKWYSIDTNGNVTASEAAISITLFKHLIPNYSKLSFKEASEYVLKYHPEILAYRIPTQGQSSAMYLKIVKLLPEQVGDTIILPKAVTALTGSDFDIDKMFAVRHSYFVNDSGELERVKFFDKAEGDVSPQELAFEQHQAYVISKYRDQIKALQEKLFNHEVPQSEKINSIVEFTESLKEAIPESLYNSMQDILSDMVISELEDEFIGIDKIKELASLLNSWNHDEAKKAFLAKHENSTPYEYNSEQAVKNRLLDAYLSVYKNTNNIPQTQSPLGSYKKLITQLANSIKDVDGGNMFHTYSASNQNILKFEYTGGKDGIGPFALNNSHHVLSQIAGLKYKGKSFGLLNVDTKGNIDLSTKLGKDNKNVMAWLSALIDAHVDLAKDNYIMKVNVNAATYNFVAFMIRAGFGLNTFKLTSQPIIKDLADRINNSGKYSKMSLYTSKKSAFYHTKEYWKGLLSEEALKEYDERVFDNNSVYSFIHVKNSLENKYYNVDVAELADDKRDEFVLDQLMMFDIFDHFNRMGEDLNNFVQICQVDTKKFGRNVTEIIHYQKRVMDFKASNKFVNANILFPTNPSKIVNGESLLGPYYKNSVLFLLEMMPNLTIYSSQGFIEIVNTILNLSGNGSTLNKKLINSIADEVFASIVGDFFFDVDEDGNPEENSFGLKSGHVKTMMQSVIDTLTRIKYSDEPIAKRFRDNPIFSLLLKRPLSEDKGLPFTSYIAVVRKAFSDTMSINDYMYGVLDLLSAQADPNNAEEVKMIEEIHKFARSLFVYSFLNSGFRNKLHSFYNIIPPVLYKSLKTAQGRELSYNEFIKGKKELFSSDINTALSVYVDRVFRNNWMNKQIVPTLIERDVLNGESGIFRDIQVPVKHKETGDISYKWRRATTVKGAVPPIKAVVLSANSEGSRVNRKYYLGQNADKDPVFVKYILYRERREDTTDIHNNPVTSFRPYLLEYVGYMVDYYEEEGSDEREKLIEPVYKVVKRDSYEKSGVVLKTPGLTPDSILENANEENLIIEDGMELDYFNDKIIQSQSDSKEFIPVTNLAIITPMDEARMEVERTLSETNVSEKTYTKKSTTPEFDKLPYKGVGKNMVYTGIGSRETPDEVLTQIAEIAKELQSKGYTLRTGDAKGADEAFRNSVQSKEVYTTKDATDTTRTIAKEIHPNPAALKDYVLDLMARNTSQVFGDNLDVPTDFVLYWALESDNPMRPQGGTGQAVEMANRKGIPTINMGDPNWRNKLDSIINPNDQQIETGDVTLGQLKDALNEKFKDQDNFTPLTLKDVINMTPEQISNLKNCL